MTNNISRSDILGYVRQGSKYIIAALMGAVIAYSTGYSVHRAETAELEERIAELQKKEQQAIITRRISEQMEDIAFQQRAISDKQRVRAEEQSKIADIERGKAELERGLAQAAERKAIQSAAQADSMRVVAEHQSAIATENMHQAQEAQAKADTLFYQALGRSLAHASLKESATGSPELTKLLAYASWHYTEAYNGDRYQQDIYHSLLVAADETQMLANASEGSIRGIQLCPGMKKSCCFGVTDCGEILYGNVKRRTVTKLDNCDFRDVLATDTFKCIALDLSGKLIFYDERTQYIEAGSSKPITYPTIMLPTDKWKKLLMIPNSNIIVAMGTRVVAWIDRKERKLLASAATANELTAMGMEDNTLHVFGKNGDHHISNSPGELTHMPFNIMKESVTNYVYHSANAYHILGMSDGKINIFSKSGELLRTLLGHTGPITHMKTVDDLLATTSYDHTLKFWSLSNLNTIINPFELKYEHWPLTFDIHDKTKIIWLGTESGTLNIFCISATRNSQTIAEKLTRDFTQEEWDYYIGPSVPYQSFKPVN